jgi:eukaryotic-like serine/threonine-protein kinase
MSARLTPTGVPLDESGAAPAPLRLGRYTLQDTLGEGAMGVVYRAHDPQLDRTVALKTFRKPACGSAAASMAAALRLRNEAQAAARLSHPGIVAVYEYGEDGDQSFIVMEYVRGTPLLTGLAQPLPLPIDDVLCLVVQLLVALQCAHEQGVWHRDIKPANLMVTPEGRLKITDFGIARMSQGPAGDEVTPPRAAGVMGSPGYLAPECYDSGANGGRGDQRADVYACGVLLFELLTGKRPFRGSPDVVMYKTLHLPVPPLAAPDDPQFVPLARFAHVVQRALAKSPDDRYSSALEMRTALTLAAERTVPHALSPPAMRLLSPPSAAVGNAVPSAPPAAATPAPTPVSAPAPAPAPAPRPTSKPFAEALLARLAAELVDDLGPVAECVVRRASTQGDESVNALLMRVANAALPVSRRGAFIERMRIVLATQDSAAPHGPATHPPTGVVVPVLNDVLSNVPEAAPLSARLLDDAQQLMAQHVGPLAALLVRRAAAGATGREGFIARLANLAAEGVERERIFAALCRLR